jgi:hypothetical protein
MMGLFRRGRVVVQRAQPFARSLPVLVQNLTRLPALSELRRNQELLRPIAGVDDAHRWAAAARTTRAARTAIAAATAVFSGVVQGFRFVRSPAFSGFTSGLTLCAGTWLATRTTIAGSKNDGFELDGTSQAQERDGGAAASATVTARTTTAR